MFEYMNKQQISIDYFPDGDMLSVTFGETGRKGQGFELNEYIYIRIDVQTHEPLGLTFLSYSRLVKLNQIALSFWDKLSDAMQQILLSILMSYPVNLFLNIEKKSIDINPVSSFPDTSIQELAAA